MADQTGYLKKSRRAQKGLKRLADLTAKYEAEGMTKTDAEARALKELRANGRSDFRAG